MRRDAHAHYVMHHTGIINNVHVHIRARGARIYMQTTAKDKRRRARGARGIESREKGSGHDKLKVCIYLIYFYSN